MAIRLNTVRWSRNTASGQRSALGAATHVHAQFILLRKCVTHFHTRLHIQSSDRLKSCSGRSTPSMMSCACWPHAAPHVQWRIGHQLCFLVAVKLLFDFYVCWMRSSSSSWPYYSVFNTPVIIALVPSPIRCCCCLHPPLTAYCRIPPRTRPEKHPLAHAGKPNTFICCYFFKRC